MSEALKPCPFCGSDDIKVSNNKPEFWHHWVQCMACEGSMDAKGGTDKAIEKWNRRPAPSPAAHGATTREMADIKRAREILARLCDQGHVRMSVPVRRDDEDMVLLRVIDALARKVTPPSAQQEGAV